MIRRCGIMNPYAITKLGKVVLLLKKNELWFYPETYYITVKLYSIGS